ncbi:MAG: DUF6808 domain-containing protein [Candidatus Cryptobacteroides sp.]
MKLSEIPGYILVIILTMLSSFYIFTRCQDGRPGKKELETVRDTVILKDTVIITRPLSEVRYKRDSIIITLPEIRIEMPSDTVHDTIYVWLPAESIVWTDSLCSVYAHGVMTEIDSVLHFNTSMLIYQEEKPRPKRWGLGVQAGYGASRDGLTPYIGIGLTYNIVRF